MLLSGQRVLRLVLVVLFLAALAFYVIPQQGVYAAALTSRSLTLEAGTVPGSAPGDGNSAHTVNHLFTFTIASGSNLGSIQFLYCTTASGTCTTPNGLSTSAATLGGQTGPATGFTLVNTTNGSPYLTRTASTVTTGTASTFTLDGIVNPDSTNCFGGTTPQSNNCPFYVRITTFASTDTTGGSTDSGTVAASTVSQIVLTGTMPESLIFCTGATISVTNTIPDCSTATSGAVSFNQLFSPADTSTATTQMAASTNAPSGYSISVNGPTLTSGANTITAMSSADTSKKGFRQFGMNLVANTSASAASFPGTSANIAPAANGTNFRGEPLSGYNTADTFKFNSTDAVADSAGTTGSNYGPTDAQIYTVSYIVNVSGGQPIGTYVTTLTYICTATF
ncbi:MAG: hypothetical protein ACREGG_02050 [Candidatus Saccharimonadales bacterium]